jgi:hypothetical protein
MTAGEAIVPESIPEGGNPAPGAGQVVDPEAGEDEGWKMPDPAVWVSPDEVENTTAEEIISMTESSQVAWAAE